MSGSRTTTKADRLANVHPGDVLREDFLIGSDIPVAEVAAETGINAGRLSALIACSEPVDADTDLRLARYFGISEGVLLGLQNDYDLEEVKRTRGKEIARITKRAA